MGIICASCFIALALIIWFKTSAFVEYIHLFKLGRFFHVDEYMEMDTDSSYPEFLKEYFDCFLTRLLSCPVCLSVWAGFIAICFTGFATYTPITLLSLFLYLVVSKLL